MEKLSQEELNIILDKHKKYLQGEEGAKKAYLSNKDCSGLDFSNNDLSYISLINCDLTKANLSDCDLTGAFFEEADLTGVISKNANLTGIILKNANLIHYRLINVKGLITTEEYMNKNFEFDEEQDGYIVYKTFGSRFIPPRKWIIKENSVIEENCDIDRRDTCSYGINCGTLDWVRNYNTYKDVILTSQKYNLPIWKMLIKKEWFDDIVVPYTTDGKIRCNKALLLNIVE